MLRSFLYFLLMFTTSMRLVDMIYLLSKDTINLPVTVIAVTSAMIIYGIVLLAKRFLGNLGVRHLMAFYLIQAGAIVFNMIYIALFCPLHLSIVETLAVGSFLDILIDFCAVYVCVKCIRDEYSRPFVKVIGDDRRQA